MYHKFKKGDQVTWNSEFGEVQGKVINIHTKDFDFLEKTRHATPESPQYEVQSVKTDKMAAHKEAALYKSKK